MVTDVPGHASILTQTTDTALQSTAASESPGRLRIT